MKIATAKTRFATTWANSTIMWGDLLDRLRETTRTPETLAEYNAMTRAQQDAIKDVGGFVLGHLAEGRRRNGAVLARSCIALDVDHADPNFWATLTMLHDWCCVIYSTHKHTPESPRLRLLVLLSREVSADEYQPIARRIAEWLGIDQFDDTTYQPTRLMYWPSTSRDGQYVFHHQDGPPLDPDEVLATYDNWRDATTWPLSSRETTAPRAGTTKAADPTTKPGLVGAFCRAYTVPEAIEAFLADIYTPGSQGRWSYTRGESANGLVVYNDGRFAYSNHATDPAGGQNCNAFDLVRLHKFGELDTDTEPNTPINRLPSYTAMSGFAAADPGCKHQLLDDRAAEGAEEFQPIPDDVQLDTSWHTGLELDRGGRVKDTLPNLCLIMTRDQRLSSISWDELADTFDVREPKLLPWPHHRPGWTDADHANLRGYLAQAYGVYHQGRTHDALLHATSLPQRRHHPIRAWLAQLPEWDGVGRVDQLLIDHLGAEDTIYVREATRKMLVAMVARALRPGTKFDHMVVLQGPQGIGKSVLCSKLGGAWFSDSLSLSDMRDKTGPEKLRGHWLLELSELAGIRKMDVETIKSFITTLDDKYRPAYGRSVESHPRQCVFIGTTNDQAGFLRDITGNRRFWPIQVTGETELKPWHLTQTDIDQLFTEAVTLYAAGEPLHLAGEAAAGALIAQAGAVEADEREGLVREYLDTLLPANWEWMGSFERSGFLRGEGFTGGPTGTVQRTEVSNAEIWTECLGRQHGDMLPRDSYTIASIMTRIEGWERTEQRVRQPIYGRQRIYRRTE